MSSMGPNSGVYDPKEVSLVFLWESVKVVAKMYIASLIGDVLHGRLRERAAFVRPALPRA